MGNEQGTSSEHESKEVIIDFCKGCGHVTYEGQGLERDPHCTNCSRSLSSTESRIQGTFHRNAAIALRRVCR